MIPRTVPRTVPRAIPKAIPRAAFRRTLLAITPEIGSTRCNTLRTLSPTLHKPLSTSTSDVSSRTSTKEMSAPPASAHSPISPSERPHQPATPTSGDEVAHLAAQPFHTLTLHDLVRYGRPPLSPQNLLASARYTRSILPIHLAKRIVSLRSLPFIIVSNPNVSEIYNNYVHSFRAVLNTPQNYPTTLAEEAQFTEVLKEIVKTHSNTIPTLAKGFVECKRYISSEEVGNVLERHLRARIGTRLLVEQHIALHEASTDSSTRGEQGEQGGYIGTIDTNMLPLKIIETCASFVGEICELRYGVCPRLVIEGHIEERFPYIPVHLEYIITELLKNAFRATVESPNDQYPNKGGTTSRDNDFPPVVVTLAVSRREGVDGAGIPGEKVLSIRIRDRGGGIAPEIMPNIWKYSFTTFDPERGRFYPTPSSPTPSSSNSALASGTTSGVYSSVTNITGTTEDSNPMNMNLGMAGAVMPMDALNITSGMAAGNVISGAGGGSSIAGLGYGLPLSRAYAEYFGGSLSLQSCFGWGTDVYLMLKGIDVINI